MTDETIAPPNKDGEPDLYNHFPTRIVPYEEAVEKGWTWFYAAEICRYGHQAPRYVSNPRLCVDCRRVSDGKSPIGIVGIAPIKERSAPVVETRKHAKKGPSRVDGISYDERRFLQHYARHKDFSKAAEKAKIQKAVVDAAYACNHKFKAAVDNLEKRLNIKRSTEAEVSKVKYWWSNDKRDQYIEVFVDTGDAATARDAIGVTPSEFFRELNRNSEFAERVKDAGPLAAKALEERAIQLALKGNDKLLTKVLSAKMPEYRERVQMDMNVTEKLDDRQLDARLNRLLSKFQDRFIEADFRVIESGEDGTAGDIGRIGQEGKPSEDVDLLHGDGSLSEGTVSEADRVLSAGKGV